MNTFKILTGMSLVLVLLAAPAVAGDFDGKKNLICAPVDLIECLPGGKCNQIVADEIDFPDFFRINFEKKEIRSQQSGHEKRKTSIEHMEEIDGKLFIQGAEDGLEGADDGLGWSMALDQNNGRMVLTAAGREVAFVIFGVCTVP